MEKGPEEDRGMVRSCSKCGCPLAFKINIWGFGSLHVYCRNVDCNSDEKITIGQKQIVIVASALVLLCIIFSGYGKIYATKINCDSFRSPDRTRKEAQVAAQKYFDSKEPGYKRLDGWDKDAIVCEKFINN